MCCWLFFLRSRAHSVAESENGSLSVATSPAAIEKKNKQKKVAKKKVCQVNYRGKRKSKKPNESVFVSAQIQSGMDKRIIGYSYLYAMISWGRCGGGG